MINEFIKANIFMLGRLLFGSPRPYRQRLSVRKKESVKRTRSRKEHRKGMRCWKDLGICRQEVLILKGIQESSVSVTREEFEKRMVFDPKKKTLRYRPPFNGPKILEAAFGV